MINTRAPKRSDSMGNGEFGAPRGSRTHNGIDYAVAPDSSVLAVVSGKVTKHGYPYNPSDEKKGHLRYIQVTDDKGNHVRYFYVLPSLDIGTEVEAGDEIAIAQDLQKVYGAAMTSHVHLEVKTPDGKYINPEEYFA